MKNKKNIFIKTEKLLDRLYKCRDLELNLLWQRSIFLTAFMIVFLTAYGGIWITDKPCFAFFTPIFHGAGVFIGVILLAFSLLWYQMAKGSKFWYEVYEEKIKNLENDFGISKEMRNSEVPVLKTARYSLSEINISIGIILMIIAVMITAFHLLFFICMYCCDCICFCQIFKIFFLVAFIGFVATVIWALFNNKR